MHFRTLTRTRHDPTGHQTWRRRRIQRILRFKSDRSSECRKSSDLRQEKSLKGSSTWRRRRIQRILRFKSDRITDPANAPDRGRGLSGKDAGFRYQDYVAYASTRSRAVIIPAICFFFIRGSRRTCCAAIIFAASWILIPAGAVFKGAENASPIGVSSGLD